MGHKSTPRNGGACTIRNLSPKGFVKQNYNAPEKPISVLASFIFCINETIPNKNNLKEGRFILGHILSP